MERKQETWYAIYIYIYYFFLIFWVLGNGTYFYAGTGSIYEGEWLDDMRNGYGTFSVPMGKPTITGSSSGVNVSEKSNKKTTSSQRSASPVSSKSGHSHKSEESHLRKVYAGEWKNDKREGFGTYYYDDGGCYEGSWENDKKEGWGKMRYADGTIYEGEWHREMRHGQGILLLSWLFIICISYTNVSCLLANGDRYEGMWLDDFKEGPGKFIYRLKRQAYEGEWVKGLPKCGTIVDLPPLHGTMPRKYPIPAVSETHFIFVTCRIKKN